VRKTAEAARGGKAWATWLSNDLSDLTMITASDESRFVVYFSSQKLTRWGGPEELRALTAGRRHTPAEDLQREGREER
jgi:hypothetical protein